MQTKYDTGFESGSDSGSSSAELVSAVMRIVCGLGIDREPIDHVNRILVSLGVDVETVAAGMLFEAVASNRNGVIEQATALGSDTVIALLTESLHIENRRVEWVSVAAQSQKDTNVSAAPMMLLSLMKDTRVVFILLAHQLCRIRLAKRADDEVRRRVAEETRQVFTSLANRLGIGQIKWEMEDLAFRYLQPDDYKRIAEALEERRINRETYMETMVSRLCSLLNEAGIRAQVYGRPKHIFSIWRKMQTKHLDFEKLYDVRAVRIVVDDVTSCYEALSVVHSAFNYIPAEYDDYIAAPKANGYQSLHTAIIGPENKTVEVQIRTEEMHRNAELGVAAHWRYKEGGKQNLDIELTIDAIRSALIAGENEVQNQNSLIVPRKIYVLSPQGRVVELPKGATPLDFAYKIHTEVGHRCRGAKVDGKIVPLTTALKSGQQIEILTGKTSQPSRDWLAPQAGYITTGHALSKVRHWFKQEFRDEYIVQGKALLIKELDGIEVTSKQLQDLTAKFNYGSVDDLWAALGRGDLGIMTIANIVRAAQRAKSVIESLTTTPITKTSRRPSEGVEILGVGNLLTQLAKCCKPIPGDTISGFITLGRGVSIHRMDCRNLAKLNEQHPERVIPVNWGELANDTYVVDILITATDRSGLLKDISSILTAEHMNVIAVNTRTSRRTKEAQMKLSIEIRNSEQLHRALSKIAAIRDVVTAMRAI